MIIAVVVLYNPEECLLRNLSTYLTCVAKIVLVDNSSVKNFDLINQLKSIEKVEYMDNEGNKGIANALNKGIQFSINKNADWLLTMDQDSFFGKNSLEKMISYLNKIDTSKLGILAPRCILSNSTVNQEFDDRVTHSITVWTSGNLVNLSVVKKVGLFEEKYFIDSVDHEFCLRLKKNNFNVLTMQNAMLFHELGDIQLTSFFGKLIASSNHSPIRRYYMARNRLDVIKRYYLYFPLFCLKDIKLFFFEWLKVILFEDHKLKKQKMFLLGFFDFCFQRFGKYPYIMLSVGLLLL